MGVPDGEKNDDLMKRGIVVGLLSSSCCLLQVFINALSWFNVLHLGCAGFNKVLGPPRPYLRAITFGWLGMCWYQDTKLNSTNGRPKMNRLKLLRATTVTLVVMFLPEILQVWDHSHPIIRRSLTSSTTKKDQWMERTFIVNGMGCEGCQSAVRNLLESIDEVQQAQVDWESGIVSVFGEAVESMDMVTLGKILESHGYELDKTESGGERLSWN